MPSVLIQVTYIDDEGDKYIKDLSYEAPPLSHKRRQDLYEELDDAVLTAFDVIADLTAQNRRVRHR